MEIIGYLASLVIGISLGLIGGGGSILTVPVLVYLFGVEPILATAYSLFIVGSTSLVGLLKYKQGLVNLKTAIIFGAPSILAVFATRKYIIPLIPNEVFTIGSFGANQVDTDDGLICHPDGIRFHLHDTDTEKAGRKWERRTEIQLSADPAGRCNCWCIDWSCGCCGGFLIIPALVLLSKLPMKQAVGTSLLIIAAKSLIGFTGDLSHTAMDWKLLLIVTALAIAGIFIGDRLSKKIDGDSLKKGFGWFVLVMGIYIIVQQLFFPLGGGH